MNELRKKCGLLASHLDFVEGVHSDSDAVEIFDGKVEFFEMLVAKGDDLRQLLEEDVVDVTAEGVFPLLQLDDDRLLERLRLQHQRAEGNTLKGDGDEGEG